LFLRYIRAGDMIAVSRIYNFSVDLLPVSSYVMDSGCDFLKIIWKKTCVRPKEAVANFLSCL
jgi:hypothetical protein